MGIGRTVLALVAVILLWAGLPGLALAQGSHHGHHGHHAPAAEQAAVPDTAQSMTASVDLAKATKAGRCACRMAEGECMRSQCQAAPTLMAADAAAVTPPSFSQAALPGVMILAAGGIPDPPQRPPSPSF